jgi:peptide/nickel transport system permease protein
MWREKTFRFGFILVLAILVLCVCLPWIVPQDPYTQNLEEISRPPSFSHPFGTDFFGRDLFTRILYGGRSSLTIGIVVTFFAVAIGTIIGMISGYFGGRIDAALMRFVDVMLGFPRLFILLTVIGFTRPSFGLMLVVLSLFSWMEVARVVRAEVLSVRERLYVKSAVALGLNRRRVLFRYIFPNILGPIIVSATLMIGSVIVIESGLSFIGLGVQPPDASWGTILNQGFQDLAGAWWITLFSGLAIVVTVIGFNLAGDGLRNVLDPKTGERES